MVGIKKVASDLLRWDEAVRRSPQQGLPTRELTSGRRLNKEMFASMCIY